MVAVIATSAGLFTLFYVRASSIESSERLALRAAAFSAGLASSEIDTSIGQLAASTGGLASTPNIGDVVASPQDCSLSFNGVGVFPGGRLDLVTPEGEVACSSDTSIVTDGVSYSTDDWFERANEDGQVLASTRDPVSGASVLVQAVTTPSGVVVAGFLELGELGPALADRFGGPREFEFLVTDDRGELIIARSIDPSRWVGTRSETAWPDDGSFERADLDGTPRYYGHASLDSLEWSVYAGDERSRVLASTEEQFRRTGLVIGIGLILMFWTLWILWRRRVAEEAGRVAHEANLAKSEFLSRMSHELRTPLNAILGFAQLLQLEELPEDQRESTDQIVKGGRRLLELINEVLDIARIESGTLRLSLEPVLVEEVVHDAVELIRPLANDRGISLRSELPTDMTEEHVEADRQRLGQVVLNLLSNAVKYNVQGGSVSVSARTWDGRIRIGVTDTGPGISEDKIPLLFTPFERLGAEQTNVEGTGLGLALSKNLVEAMGGVMHVDTMMGEGTTFWVELKIADAPRPVEQPIAVQAESHSVSAGKLLYIEDNLANVRLIERILRRRDDVELISAMTGALGIELAQQHRPDLILLDLQLPDLQGDTVLARLRKDPRTASIPVVMLSADATQGQIERLLAAGATDYVTKPIDVAAFLAKLDAILGSQEEEQ